LPFACSAWMWRRSSSGTAVGLPGGAVSARPRAGRRRAFRGANPRDTLEAASVGTTASAKRHLLSLFPAEQPFDTPKPEELIHRVLAIATNPDDLVVDPYLGSGTTAAVAHKMRRRWIGIEVSELGADYAGRRLAKVVEGESGGVSESVGWTGGGRFSTARVRAPGAFAA
jgi:adenine-specific DNA-methyltransferase